MSACERPLPASALRPLQRSLGSGWRSQRRISGAKVARRAAKETAGGTTEELPGRLNDRQQPLPLADESGLQQESSGTQEQPQSMGAQSPVAAAVAALRQGLGSRLQPELVAIALGEHALCSCAAARMMSERAGSLRWGPALCHQGFACPMDPSPTSPSLCSLPSAGPAGPVPPGSVCVPQG